MRERFPSTTLLLISGRRLPTFTHRAYLSNIPFVLKPLSGVEVREFLRRLEVAPLPADGVMDRVQRTATHYRLSPPQVRLLSRLVTGASRADVAAELGISVNTLKRRTRILLRETGQRTTRDLVRMVLSG
jgi:FixJ family two-component response regulator